MWGPLGTAFGGDQPPWQIALEVAMATGPGVIILVALFSKSKTASAFAQLGGVQERADTRDALARTAVSVDKLWFQIGVVNVSFTSWMLGAFPALYYLVFTPKVLIFTILRLVTFYKKKQHFLLWDFCYWANFLCIYVCWFTPKSPAMIQTMFMCANGPLAWSVLAFSHAMIFHSYAHVTSVIIHTSPLVLSYGIRWYAAPMSDLIGSDHFNICDGDAKACLDVTFLELVGGALSRFYIWWMLLYYVWIFVALGPYVERNGYQTLWDRILKMKPFGPFLKGLLERFPKLVVQFVYLLLHLFFSTVTMVFAVVLWHSQLAHFFFMCCILFTTVRNAGDFYFTIFEANYTSILGRQGNMNEISKKIVAASGALGDMHETLTQTER